MERMPHHDDSAPLATRDIRQSERANRSARCSGGTGSRRGPSRWIVIVALAAIPAELFSNAIDLTFHSVTGGVSVAGAGTNVASFDYGTVSAFDALGSGVSRTTTASDYTIETQFGVRVVRNTGSSPNYTLRARLQNTDPLTWKVDGVTMTTNFTTVATLQPYDSILSHMLAFVVPFSRAAGSISTGFEVMAVAN